MGLVVALIELLIVMVKLLSLPFRLMIKAAELSERRSRRRPQVRYRQVPRSTSGHSPTRQPQPRASDSQPEWRRGGRTGLVAVLWVALVICGALAIGQLILIW